MIYRDLINFEPVVSVKVLREAENIDEAREDVRTYVISERMSQAISSVLVPNLRFDKPEDQKGLMVVANYGTGKTHLMSTIAAVAEHAELTKVLTNSDVAKAVKPIAGRFSVIRSEIGATQMGLRNIVCDELERGLAAMGVKYKFPSLDKTSGTKTAIVAMMKEFEKVEPDKGLLFVLDELLDYLRSRKDTELISDLAFLREVGEICRSTRFRFVAGVQETIFDNPRFANAAEAVLRVKDRFEQVRIAREDISYVVQERLLCKSVGQRDAIREHLQRFTPAFDGMAENIEEFIRLFPVHPAYIRAFERITLVEKRKILTTLSAEMTRLLDTEVSQDDPGLVSYDGYRAELDADPSNRTIPEVKEVLERAAVLRNRVEKSMPTKEYIPTALRIVDGLAIHRLTTDDIYAPIGATPDELRDDLCLLPTGVPEMDSVFLRVTIESILDDIVRAVSGQFISENTDNGQFYLDVRKDIDYDQKIEERATSLDNDKLDDAYFRALEQVLEQRDQSYVAGYRIWQYELTWAEKNVTRIGYLFMGAPNERSTAQPPRDFYVYFLQPYAPPSFTDEEKADEVFFRLAAPDKTFTDALRHYAGADALAIESSAGHRLVYEEKRQAALKEMSAWLRAHMAEAVHVSYRGETRPLGESLAIATGPLSQVKNLVDAVAAALLKPHFETRYPGYPILGATVTLDNRAETVKQALSQIVTGKGTTLGSKVLPSLELVDHGGDLVDTGPYAKALLDAISKSNGKSVNRDALLVERDPGVYTWGTWHLEPLWLTVVAAALCQLGRLEIGFPSVQLDAPGLGRLLQMSVDELEQISHIAPPKPTPVAQLQSVCELLGLPRTTIPNTGATEPVVKQLLTAAESLLREVTEVSATVVGGVELWGALVVDQQIERGARLDALKSALEDVRARDSVGKMNRLSLSDDDLAKAGAGKDELTWSRSAMAARNQLSSTADYLRQAFDVFADANPLEAETQTLREEMLDVFRSPEPVGAAALTALRKRGDDLRNRYADEATRAHARDRLDAAGDTRKREILDGADYRDLRALAAVSLLPSGVFGSLERELAGISSCKTFDESTLRSSVVCAECGYRPRGSDGPTARSRIEEIESRLVTLRKEWEQTLIDNLAPPEMAAQVKLLKAAEKQAVEDFLASGKLPSPVSDAFIGGVNNVLERFEVRRITPSELWDAIFPAAQPATPEELVERFAAFVQSISQGGDSEKIRIVPDSGDAQ